MNLPQKYALLNRPSPAIANCELTFIDRAPISFEKAVAQHASYARALRKLGVHVRVADVNPTLPDAVFIEDTAIILDNVAILASMGNVSRRAELPAIAEVLSKVMEIARVFLPATIDGGDVLRVGKTLYIGKTSRTNTAGIDALWNIAEPLGYQVVPVNVNGCLHLKTCITALDDETFISNPGWYDASPFKALRRIDVDIQEPWAANVLRIDDQLILNAAYPRTADKIESLGYRSQRVDISELAKAEAGLTCLSLIFENAI